jgi:hypothetical protein
LKALVLPLSFDDCGRFGKVSTVLRTVTSKAKIKSVPPHPNPLPQRGRGGRELIFRVLRI